MKTSPFSASHHPHPPGSRFGHRLFERGHHAHGDSGPHGDGSRFHRHGPHPQDRIRGSHEGHGGPHGHGPHLHGARGEQGRGGHPGHPGHPGHRGGGRGGRGGDGGSRRPLGRGDLRLLLLALIEQQPRHGYELIQLIGELFGGAYVPSPGVVYPTLALLEDLGLIAAEEEGGRKRYAITDAGREQANTDREAIEAARERTEDSARRVRKAAVPMPVREAMELLKGTLIRREHSWSDEEAARVARIIAEAAARIDPETPAG